MFITANAPSSHDWRKRIKDIGRDSPFGDIDTEVESQQPIDDQVRFIFVGVVPVPVPTEAVLDRGKGNGRGAVGVIKPKNCLQPTTDKAPFRVVAPVTTTLPEGGLKMYVLTDKDPVTRLWNPHPIPHDHVFFFSEYRNGVTTIADRRTTWIQKIVLASAREAEEMTKFDRRLGSSYKGDATSELMAELHALFTEFNFTNSPEVLERAVQRINQHENAATTPLLSYMNQFLSIHGEECTYAEADAQKFSNILLQRWPFLAHLITEENLLILHREIEHEGLEIELRYGFSFIVHGCTQLMDDPQPHQVAHDSMLFAIRVLDDNDTFDFHAPASSRFLFADALMAIAEELQEIHDANVQAMEEMAVEYGSQTIRRTPEGLASRLPLVTSRDSFRTLAEHVVASGVDKAKVTMHYNATRLKKIIDVINHRAAMLAEVSRDKRVTVGNSGDHEDEPMHFGEESHGSGEE